MATELKTYKVTMQDRERSRKVKAKTEREAVEKAVGQRLSGIQKEWTGHWSVHVTRDRKFNAPATIIGVDVKRID